MLRVYCFHLDQCKRGSWLLYGNRPRYPVLYGGVVTFLNHILSREKLEISGAIFHACKRSDRHWNGDHVLLYFQRFTKHKGCTELLELVSTTSLLWHGYFRSRRHWCSKYNWNNVNMYYDCNYYDSIKYRKIGFYLLTNIHLFWEFYYVLFHIIIIFFFIKFIKENIWILSLIIYTYSP